MIEVEGLTKSFGSTMAVDRLTFTVRPGVVTGLLGPNGAGKSTMMRLMLGLIAPTSGRALIDGRRYSELTHPLSMVGALLDTDHLHPGRSARSHLRWMAASHRIPASRVDEVLGLVGLSRVARQRVGRFSLGMKQRLGLAGALLGDPRVLILDEPVNGLDPQGIVWLRDYLRDRAANGCTVVVSSHLLSEMARTADDLVVITGGRLIANMPVAEFTAGRTTARIRSPRLTELVELLSARPGASAEIDHTPTGDSAAVTGLSSAEIGVIAASAGIALTELSQQETTLESAFMQATTPQPTRPVSATPATAPHDRR